MSAKNKPGKKTFANQDELPSLPVPRLQDTCEKYLKSVQPLLTPEEFHRTKMIVNRFQEPGGIGEKLHEKLLAKAKRERNWLERWWEDLVYLSPRDPNAIFVNYYAAAFQDLPVLGAYSQANATACIMGKWLDFKESIENQTLPPEYMAGVPLCMNQFSRMFNECRIPGETMDEIKTFPGRKHVVVLRKNQIYWFDVYHPDGKRYSEAEMEVQLDKILEIQDKESNLNDPPISILTGGDRTNWYNAREALLALDPVNKQSLDMIESSIFAIVLDDSEPSGRVEVSRGLLHGSGYDRWFDKSVQLVGFKNGLSGANGEHSYADAMVIVTMGHYVYDQVMKSGTVRFDRKTIGPLPTPQKLQWKINEQIEKHINEAKTTLLKNIDNLDLNVLRSYHIGKNYCKQAKIHPDVAAQLALQLAYYRTYGEPCGTYETGHTRMYYHGRTETIRPCSNESFAWTKAMMNPEASNEEKLRLFDDAIKAHQRYSEWAITGQAVDRHLLGLRIVAALEGMTDLAIFTDKGYQKSTKYILSTSNVGYQSMWGGFAPVDPEGYGCCYTIQPDSFTVSITTYKACGFTCPRMFAAAIDRSFADIRELTATRIAKL